MGCWEPNSETTIGFVSPLWKVLNNIKATRRLKDPWPFKVREKGSGRRNFWFLRKIDQSLRLAVWDLIRSHCRTCRERRRRHIYCFRFLPEMSPSVKRSLSVHFEDANFSLLDKEEAIQAKTAEAWQEMPLCRSFKWVGSRRIIVGHKKSIMIVWFGLFSHSIPHLVSRW